MTAPSEANVPLEVTAPSKVNLSLEVTDPSAAYLSLEVTESSLPIALPIIDQNKIADLVFFSQTTTLFSVLFLQKV